MDPNAPTTVKPKRLHFELLLPFLFHPIATFPQVVQKRQTWLTPLLVVSLLLVARAMLAPAAVSATPGELTPDPGLNGPIPRGKGGYLPGNTQLISAQTQKGGGGGEGEGGPVQEGPAVETGPGLLEKGFSALGALLGLWAGWFLLSILLYIGTVVSGGNNSFTETLNLTAWAGLPLGFKQIVMLAATLAVPSLAAIPGGASALAGAVSGPAGMFLSALLKSLDIYLVWQVALLWLGLRRVSPLAPRRIAGVTLGAVALFLVLVAMPGFFTAVFLQLTAPVPVSY